MLNTYAPLLIVNASGSSRSLENFTDAKKIAAVVVLSIVWISLAVNPSLSLLFPLTYHPRLTVTRRIRIDHYANLRRRRLLMRLLFCLGRFVVNNFACNFFTV